MVLYDSSDPWQRYPDGEPVSRMDDLLAFVLS